MPEKETIHQLFNDIAVKYDRFNHVSSMGTDKRWRRVAVRQVVDADSPLQILDVATGTADFAIAIAKKAPAGSTVTGVDISEGMLQVGREKCKGLPITLLEADAESLPFPDNSFDRVTVAFGVRNFENLEKGLMEMRRVLKPQGKLVILELSYPKCKFIFKAYKLYSLRILPAIGTGMTGNRSAFTYLPNSILKFPLPQQFMPMLTDCGYTEVIHRQFMFGVCRMYCATK